MDEIGLRLGLILVMAAVATLTGPPAGGAITVANGGSYTGTCIMSGLSFVITLVGFIVVRTRVGGWKVTANV